MKNRQLHILDPDLDQSRKLIRIQPFGKIGSKILPDSLRYYTYVLLAKRIILDYVHILTVQHANIHFLTSLLKNTVSHTKCRNIHYIDIINFVRIYLVCFIAQQRKVPNPFIYFPPFLFAFTSVILKGCKTDSVLFLFTLLYLTHTLLPDREKRERERERVAEKKKREIFFNHQTSSMIYNMNYVRMRRRIYICIRHPYICNICI